MNKNSHGNITAGHTPFLMNQVSKNLLSFVRIKNRFFLAVKNAFHKNEKKVSSRLAGLFDPVINGAFRLSLCPTEKNIFATFRRLKPKGTGTSFRSINSDVISFFILND